jgi:2-amino-4-hydroxy-6-hydroxymethyldihydropteridine diphosphokinase
MSERTAYIGLGSNLDSLHGSPAQTLRAALARLEEPGDPLGQVTACSSFYETDPVGHRGQPLFVNAVVALKTALAPVELLQGLLKIEREFGRYRDRAVLPLTKGPRTLDLDLLLVEDLKLDLPELTLPHPALAERRFVLEPLAEIAPDLRPPGLGRCVIGLLARLPDEGENRIAGVRRCATSEVLYGRRDAASPPKP